MTFLHYIMATAAGAFGLFLAAFGVFLIGARIIRNIVTYGND